MALPTYTVACTRMTQIAPDIWEIVFEKPAGFTFRAGQFVLFKTPLAENPDDLQARAFSIASAPDDPELLFAIKLNANGRMSNWIRHVCKIGATLDMQGPFGIFTMDRTTPKDFLFVGTSTGIAPFVSQIEEMIANKDFRRTDLIFGARNKADLFWLPKLKELCDRHENLQIHFGLTSGEPDWHGHHGRVQTIIPQIVEDFGNLRVFICGNPEMVKEVKNLCLTEWGMEKADVKSESYI